MRRHGPQRLHALSTRCPVEKEGDQRLAQAHALIAQRFPDFSQRDYDAFPFAAVAEKGIYLVQLSPRSHSASATFCFLRPERAFLVDLKRQAVYRLRIGQMLRREDSKKLVWRATSLYVS